jgi:hypothetical protein
MWGASTDGNKSTRKEDHSQECNRLHLLPITYGVERIEARKFRNLNGSYRVRASVFGDLD